METLMSKGPGCVQRAIMAAFAAEPNNAFLLSELCQRTYPRIKHIKKKHRVAVARAAKAIKTLDSMKRETLGCELVFYDPLNVMSYAMARLKSDSLGPGAAYRNNDYRPVRQKIWHGHDITSWRRYDISSDQIFREMLAPGGNYHRYVVEGGAWWRHAKMEHLKRSGDEVKYQRLKDQQDKELAAFSKSLDEVFAHVSPKSQRPERPPIVGYELRIGYENGDTRVFDFASRRKASDMADHMAREDDVCFCEIQRLYAGMREI